MESGIEHSNLGGVGHNSLASTNAHQVCGVMQRAKGNALFDGLDDLVVDDAGIGELHAAVQHAVTHSVNFVHGLDDTVNGVNQNLENSGNGLGMGRHGNVLDNLLVAHLVRQAAINIDALAQALGGDIAGFGVHQLILQRGTAGVDNQNVHWNYLLDIFGLHPYGKYDIISIA